MVRQVTISGNDDDVNIVIEQYA